MPPDWTALCVILLVVLVVLLVVCTRRRRLEGCARTTWVTMTTVPERLTHAWFEENLRQTISMCEKAGATLLLQVPPQSQTGVPYRVPATVHALEGAHFRIERVAADEGPITKLLPALRDHKIDDQDVIIVCDDDIVYHNDVFDLLIGSVCRHPDAVSCMCMPRPQGYACFAFRKHVLQGLQRVHIPDSCRRIDDNVIEAYMEQQGIPAIQVKHDGDDSWICSMRFDETHTHPHWDELRNDDRPSMIPKCMDDLHL